KQVVFFPRNHPPKLFCYHFSQKSRRPVFSPPEQARGGRTATRRKPFYGRHARQQSKQAGKRNIFAERQQHLLVVTPQDNSARVGQKGSVKGFDIGPLEVSAITSGSEDKICILEPERIHKLCRQRLEILRQPFFDSRFWP